jgi:hypothetical protein
MGRRWVFLLTVHHYYFTRGTIDALLRRCGFEPVRYRPHIQTLQMGYVAMRAQPYLGPLGSLGRKVVHGLGLDRAPFVYNVGQTMVTARKALGRRGRVTRGPVVVLGGSGRPGCRLYLSRAGRPVTLVERAPVLGGLCGSFRGRVHARPRPAKLYSGCRESSTRSAS